MPTTFVLVSIALGMLFPEGIQHGALTFEQRLLARETIARVQYQHQIEATQPFELAAPRQALERDVHDFLAQSAVLEDLWGVRVTPEMLMAESDRIARATRLPERLAELRTALQGDEVMIQETLVRPALVSRLFHERFDDDPVIQAGPRQEAEALAAALAGGTLRPGTDHPRLRVLGRDDLGVAAAPRRERALGKVVGETGAFVVRAAFEHDGRPFIAEYAFPRVTWEEWWQANASRFDPSRGLEVVARSTSAMPAMGNASLDSCQPGDTWADSILSQPGPVTGAYQAVWTGSVYVVIAGATSMARYDPALDAWLPVSTAGAPVGSRPTAVWSGTEVILYGGAVGYASAPFLPVFR
ncbi:MAG: hypothetical protein ACREAA_20350 [Candidatus Polarisedimenticolia bacterium]